MVGKARQAGSKDSIPARAVACLTGIVVPCGGALAQSDALSSVNHAGSFDPGVAWEVLIGSIVVCAFLGSVALLIHMALRRFKRTQARKTAFVRSALNNLSHGVVMTDPQARVVFCNDRYLDIYGLTRADISDSMTADELLALQLARGRLDGSAEDFYAQAARAEGLVVKLPCGRSVLVKHARLPNGGSIATHEDCSEQRELSRQLASTKQFLESVLDNVPVCVAAKSIEDGRYIFANRAFERFSRFSRDRIVGKRADEIFRAGTAEVIEAADRAALHAASGQHRSELVVERGSEKRILASNRVLARNERNEPEFLIALFDDVTDRRSLSRELENAKKFLELIVDNIPVSLIVERVSDGRYLLANRSAEAILGRRREEVTGLTAADEPDHLLAPAVQDRLGTAV